MSGKSDISQLSGISGISSISCASSIFQTASLPHSDQSLEKTFNGLIKCEDSICQTANYKLVYKCLEHLASQNSPLSSGLTKKLNRILVAHDTKRYLKLPATSTYNQIEDQLTLLGIADVPVPEFNNEEKKLIRAALDAELIRRISSFIKKYEELGGNLIEAMKTNESAARQELSKINDSNLSHWKNKLDEICHEYHRDVLICADLLNEWKKLKNEDLEDLNIKKAQATLLQAEIAELQARITKLTCALKMFKETSSTIDAFKILNQQLDDKISDVESEIKKKSNLLKQYNDLQSTEYDDILKRYLDLCITIEKDERLLNSL